MKTLTVPAKIVNGKLELYEPTKFKEAIKTWKDSEVELTVQYYAPKHSNEQREFYHACVVYNIGEAFSEQLGQSVKPSETHDWLKKEFNGREFITQHGEVKRIGLSTARLNKYQFMEYIDKCIQFAIDDLGIPFERFDTDLYKKAKELAEKFGMKLARPKKVKTV